MRQDLDHSARSPSRVRDKVRQSAHALPGLGQSVQKIPIVGDNMGSGADAARAGGLRKFPSLAQFICAVGHQHVAVQVVRLLGFGSLWRRRRFTVARFWCQPGGVTQSRLGR